MADSCLLSDLAELEQHACDCAATGLDAHRVLFASPDSKITLEIGLNQMEAHRLEAIAEKLGIQPHAAMLKLIEQTPTQSAREPVEPGSTENLEDEAAMIVAILNKSLVLLPENVRSLLSMANMHPIHALPRLQKRTKSTYHELAFEWGRIAYDAFERPNQQFKAPGERFESLRPWIESFDFEELIAQIHREADAARRFLADQPQSVAAQNGSTRDGTVSSAVVEPNPPNDATDFHERDIQILETLDKAGHAMSQYDLQGTGAGRISRGSVRTSLRLLETRGLVERREGQRGTFISDEGRAFLLRRKERQRESQSAATRD